MSQAPPSGRRVFPDHYRFPFGYPEAVQNVGTAAAPLLAGFSFALLGLSLDKKHLIWKPELALLLLLVAGLVLVYAVQFAFSARQFHIPPGDYLSLLELAKRDNFPETKVREWHIRSLEGHAMWAARARLAYNFGVIVLLVAVAFVLIPKPGPWHMPALRVVAVVLALVGALGEAGWSVMERPWRRRRQVEKRTGPRCV